MCEAAAAAHDAADGSHPDSIARYAAQAAYSCAGLYDDWFEMWDTARLTALALEGEAVAAASPAECRDGALDAWVEAHLGSGNLVGWAAVDPRSGIAALIRDIFPSPFRAKPAVPAAVLAWNDGCVVKLAAGIYQDRDFSSDRMGVLADALEEAGLTDEDVLGHLRGPGPHCRGCWVVDLLLGKP
jgi:hypothetical protein